MIRYAKRTAAALLILALLGPVAGLPAALAATTPPPLDITARCRFTPSSHPYDFRRAVDGLLTTVWASDGVGKQSIAIAMPKGQSVSGVYLRWNDAQPDWNLYAVDASGHRALCSSGGDDEQWLTEWAAVPAALSDCRNFVLESAREGQTLQVLELSVFCGGVPDYAPRWQRYDGKPIDTMVIACHPDDEDLYMGPMIPQSVHEGHSRNLVVTMTYVSARRRVEVSESDWLLGQSFYPALRRAIDVKTSSRSQAQVYWPLDATEGYLVEQIRKYRPSIIATHDLNGEYGHGAHRATGYAATLAFRDAADPAKYPASARRYGVWKAAKLYVHLYRGNPIALDAGKAVDAYGDRTIAQVVSAAYARHKSQLPGRALPYSGSRYDMQRFGLFDTRVGPDTHGDRLYDNVTPQAMARLNPQNDNPRQMAQPAASAQAALAATAPPNAPGQAVAAAILPAAALPRWWMLLAALALLMLASGIWLALRRRGVKRR